MESEKVITQIHKFYPNGSLCLLKKYQSHGSNLTDAVHYQNFCVRIRRVSCEVEKESPLKIAVYLYGEILSGTYRYRILGEWTKGDCMGNALTRYALAKMFEKLKYLNVCFFKFYWGTNERDGFVVNLNYR